MHVSQIKSVDDHPCIKRVVAARAHIACSWSQIGSTLLFVLILFVASSPLL